MGQAVTARPGEAPAGADPLPSGPQPTGPAPRPGPWTGAGPVAEPPLRAQALTHGFGFQRVLSGVDLRVDAGEVLAVLGPNGAGKSTLLRALGGLLRPQAGHVLWWGADPASAPAGLRARIGIIGHRSFLFDELTAEENLAYYARLLGLSSPAERARRAITEEGLGLHAGRPVGTLSRGMTQRVALCRAWLGDPAVVLADEPATGLDPEATGRLYRRLAALRAAGGAAVLVAHDLAAACAIADRYVILAGGSVADAGATEDWRGRTEAFLAHYTRAVASGRRRARLVRHPDPSTDRPRGAVPPHQGGSVPATPAAPGGTGGTAVLAAVLRRELALWGRGRDRLGATVAFGLLVALVFGFALDPTAVDLRPVFAGVLWTGLLFAGLPAFARSMAAEWDNDALDGLRATGADPVALFYGKCLGNLVGFALAEAVLVPAFLAILGVHLHGLSVPVLLALGLGTLGFVAAGSLTGAIAARALGPGAGGLLPLLALPLLTPVILGTVRVVQGVLDAAPADQGAWLLMLLAYAGLFWFLPWVLFPIVAEA